MQKFETTLWSGKCLSGEISSWGNIQLGKSPSGKCPVKELSSWRSVRQGSVSQGSALGELSSWETVLKSDRQHR